MGLDTGQIIFISGTKELRMPLCWKIRTCEYHPERVKDLLKQSSEQQNILRLSLQ
jgi:hypothetical protein